MRDLPPDEASNQEPPKPARTPLFVAVGYHGLRMVSENGTEWKNVQLGKDGEVYRNVCTANGITVAVGSYGLTNFFARTLDGAKWEQQSRRSPGVYHLLSGAVYGNDRFLAYGGDPTSDPAGNILHHSKDGAAWSDVVQPKNRRLLRRVAFGAGLFVGVGEFGRRTVSKDGLTWEDAPEANDTFKETLTHVAFGNGMFVGVGIHSLRMTTKDGITWENREAGEEGEHLNSVVWTGDRFVATGPTVTYVSSDGVRWERQSVRQGPLTMAYGAGRFVGSRGKGRMLLSEDAVRWTEVFKAEQFVEGLCYGG